MAFSHYARLSKILSAEPEGWYIRRINKPTTAKNFRGDTKHFDHYYRLFSIDGTKIRYGKFQQIERLAQALKTDVEQLPVID